METTTTDARLLVIAALWLGALMIAAVILRRWRLREAGRARAWAEEDALEDARIEAEDPGSHGFLRRWLFLAGYRSRIAPAGFVAATLCCGLIGLALALHAISSGLAQRAVNAASLVPGGVGDLASPVLAAGPWILLAILLLIPWVLVGTARRQRVHAAEQDLPVTLELLATMSESGLAFDSSLNRVIGSSPEDRPLFQELRTFQLETMSGIGRVACFRRLARRLEVASVSVFVSALVQAEQVGAGYTRVLRVQADDLRNRRREQASMLAQSLTVKLVFPLVICFLPGIFVTTLGPAVLQFLKLIESLSQGR